MTKHVYAKVPAAARDAFNAFLIGMYGDDATDENGNPTNEIPDPNAYVNGQPIDVATHCFSGHLGMSTSQASACTSYLGTVTDSGMVTFDSVQSPSWGVALSQWSLLPV